MNPEQKPNEIIRADDVRVTAHALGLLITFNYSDDLHVQAIVSKDRALGLARDILNVIYSKGIKMD